MTVPRPTGSSGAHQSAPSTPSSADTSAHYATAALSGLIAGTVMSMAVMLATMLRGESVWTMPNLIAAMWLGADVATGALGAPTFIGLLTHEATSALMGVVATPFVAGLSGRRVLLVSLAYALASYPLIFSLVMRWADPVMYQHAPMALMTWGHLVYGVVFAVAYTVLRLRAAPQSHRSDPTLSPQ